MTGTLYDVLIVGAGPAGAAAAIEARRYGLSVAVFDENRSPGGQIYREPYRKPVKDSDEYRAGQSLREDFHKADIAYFPDCIVWDASDTLEFDIEYQGAVQRLKGRTVIVATGTTEKLLPVPGSTLPNVIGLAAATIMLKSYGVVPTEPVVLAGSGPLLYAVAYGLLDKGARINAIIDSNPFSAWLKAGPYLALRPKMLLQGMRWFAKIRTVGVPVHFGCRLHAVLGDTTPEAIEIVPSVSSGEMTPRRIDAGYVIAGSGLAPATEVLRLLGARLHYRVGDGGRVPVTGEDCSTSVPDVYAAGDCCGVRGAIVAGKTGRIAAVAIAGRLGYLGADEAARRIRKLGRQTVLPRLFGAKMSELMQYDPAAVRAIAPETIVCRCEDISRAMIETAIDAGATTMNQLKSSLRCGMGPCQGRMCNSMVSDILNDRPGRVSAFPDRWSARPPVKPIPIGSIVGTFDYADIVPAPQSASGKP